MDIAETLRQEVHKGEIFDFGLAPEEQNKKLKELGIFLDGGGEGEEDGVGGPEEGRETNNNHLMMSTVDMVGYVEGGGWEGGLLEDLGGWGQAPGPKGTHDTDGAIYTLTVLNGAEPSGAWFKGEDKGAAPSLDIDSLLNIIPAPFSQQSYQGGPKEELHNLHPTYPDTKEEAPAPSQAYTPPPSVPEPAPAEVDSLLRNALQGKGFSRYNGVKVEKLEIKEEKILPLESGLVFDSGGGMGDSDNPSSAHSMDDIFLSHLDISYPEDYEKLKRIETEVAESVEQFCLDRGGFVATPPGESGLAPKGKKYAKRSKSSGASSSGVRKERSLHYCTICSKGFKDKYSVNVHIRTHTGEKPFNCSLCGKSFRQKAHLAKHYQTHVAQAKGGGGLAGGKAAKPVSTS